MPPSKTTTRSRVAARKSRMVAPCYRNLDTALSTPALGRGLHDEAQLGELLLDRQHVALDRGREAALRRQAQLFEVDVARGLVDPAQQLVAGLQLPALGRDQAEHDDLSRRDEAQRLEAARARVVPLHEEAVDVELVEERLGDEVVGA